METHYQAKLDTTAKIITALAILTMVLPSIIILLMGVQDEEPLAFWITFAIPIVVLLGTLPFIIRGYTLRDNQLLIQRIGRVTQIDLTGVQEIYVKDDMSLFQWRVMGSGGFFGYFGWFYNKELGRYLAYITDYKHAVAMKFNDKTIVVSPHDPHDFVDKVNRLTV